MVFDQVFGRRVGGGLYVFTIIIFTWELGYSKLKIIIPRRVDIRWFTRSHTHCIIVEPYEDEWELNLVRLSEEESYNGYNNIGLILLWKQCLKSVREVRWSATMRHCSGDAFFIWRNGLIRTGTPYYQFIRLLERVWIIISHIITIKAIKSSLIEWYGCNMMS